MERYIATTSDMFRNFIDTGLAQLAAAEAAAGGGPGPAPAARSSSSGESGEGAAGAPPALPAGYQQQQQHAGEPVARRPSPVPPLALQRPPLSPPVLSPSGAGGSVTTPGGTALSPSNPRLAAMRERMAAAAMRASSEGGVGGGAVSLPTSGRSSNDAAALNNMSNSLEVGGEGGWRWLRDG